jgi:hypothetical protein
MGDLGPGNPLEDTNGEQRFGAKYGVPECGTPSGEDHRRTTLGGLSWGNPSADKPRVTSGGTPSGDFRRGYSGDPLGELPSGDSYRGNPWGDPP